MAEQARFALSQGVPSAIYQKNGDVIRLAPDGPEKIGEERTGRLVLDGDVILPADGSTVNERRRIAANGLITVSVPLDANGRLAGEVVVRPFGVPIEQTNGDIVRLAPGKPHKIGEAHAGRLVLDGDVILPADGATINERRRLALYGQISVAVALQGDRLIGTPQIRIQGVPVEEDRDKFIEEAVEAAVEAVRSGKHKGDALREALRLAVRRMATRFTGKKPIVDVLIVEA
jgi:mRNA degradation ribonuclease J1/J2